MRAIDAPGRAPAADAATADGTRARLPNRSGVAPARDGVHLKNRFRAHLGLPVN